MNNLISRTGAMLACALSLASCGGGDGNLFLGGYVYGMTKPGLTLSNNGGPAITIPASSTGGATYFQFEGLEADDRFNIKVVNQPEGSECKSDNAVGKMGGYSVQEIVFECRNLPKNLSGRLNAPQASDITLNNGNAQVVVEAGQTTFTFTRTNEKGEVIGGTVGHGEPYGVTILKQPEGKTCTVQNGSGTMANDFSDVLVVCP